MSPAPADPPPLTAALGTPLLEAKLHPPPLHADYVPRPRLLAALDTARPLTLVDAPTGFGKSTLLSAWCAQGAAGRSVAWLSLDEGDNDPVAFWTYLLHTLRRAIPHGFGTALALLDQPGVSLVRAVLPTVLNELWSLDQPLVLMLDDYHVIRDEACHESLRFFLRRLPPSLRLVIATRSDPPVGMAALRARGALTELRAAQLRFTEPEAAAFLDQQLAVALPRPAVTQLTDRTEGWPAGLYLAALSLQNREDVSAYIDAFSGQHRHIVDYLGADVLDRLPAATRTFLLETSILDTLSAPLCNAVTGRSDAAEQLAELHRTNQFLIALDGHRQWFRYHHLFQDLLQLELEQTAPALVPELHRRAAAWYRTAGPVDAAIRHALAAADVDAVGDDLIAIAQPLQRAGRVATLIEWVNQLPQETIAARPALAVAVAFITALDGRPQAEVERWLAAAEAGDPALPGPFVMGEASLPAAIAIVRAAFPFGDVGRTVAAGATAVALEVDPSRTAYLLARSSYGRALYLAGRRDEAQATLVTALAALRAAQQPVMVASTLGHLALVHLDQGATARAWDLAQQGVQLVEDHQLTSHSSTALAALSLGVVLTAQGRFTKADQVLATGVEPHLTAYRHRPINYARMLLALAPVRFARGHTKAAQALVVEARSTIATCADPGILPTLLAATERALGRLPRGVTGLPDELSEAELRVLRLLPSDLSQREISRELYLSLNTVRTHLRSIFGKLGVHSRPDAVAHARRRALIA